MAVSDYSTTPADNTSISGLTVSDSTVANTLDNIIRQMMADIRAADNENAKTASAETITGNWTFAGTTIADLGTVTTVDINGGTIDNTVIGGTTPVAGGFSTIAQDGRRVALELIATSDLSGAANVGSTAFDAAKYDAYEIELINVTPSTNAAFVLQTSSNGGSSYDSGFSDYAYGINGITAGSSAFDSSSSGASSLGIALVVGGPSQGGISGTIRIHGPHVAKPTGFTWNLVHFNTTGDLISSRGAGSRVSNSVTNGVNLFFSGANIASGTVNFYGIRGN